MKKRVVGIMGAMPEEIDAVKHLLQDEVVITKGSRDYHCGKLNGVEVVVFSRWGKVAAATTVSTLINVFGITDLIFSGVAGAIHHHVSIGDVVIGTRLVQHDMDARPLIMQYEVPLLNRTFFESNDELCRQATEAVQSFLQPEQFFKSIDKAVLQQFGIIQPACHSGDIASGDKFFSSTADRDALHEALPSVVCVEMEGAAVAQVCYEYSIPFCIIRTISDGADDNSHVDFAAFVHHVASKYSLQIICNLVG